MRWPTRPSFLSTARPGAALHIPAPFFSRASPRRSHLRREAPYIMPGAAGEEILEGLQACCFLIAMLLLLLLLLCCCCCGGGGGTDGAARPCCVAAPDVVGLI